MTHGAAAGQRGGPRVPLPIGRAGHNEPPQKGLSFLPSCPSLSLFPPEMTLAKPAALLGKQQLQQDTEQQIQVCGGWLEEPSRAPSWLLVGASFFSQIADCASSRPGGPKKEEGGRRAGGPFPGGGTSPRGKGAAQLETRVNSACRRDLEGTLGLRRPRLTPSARKRVLGGAAAASGGKISPTPLG